MVSINSIHEIIGKRNLFGGWDIKPKSVKSEAFEELRQKAVIGSMQVTLRIKPELATEEPQNNARPSAIEDCHKIRETGKLDIVIRRVHDPIEQRYKSEVLTLKMGEDKLVTLTVAMFILQHEPYCFLVEEATATKAKEKEVDTTELLMQQIKAMQAEIRELRAIQIKVKAETETPVASTPTEVKAKTK